MVLPDFIYEKSLWEKGYQIVAGCDEVGRGSFAGPVVAGCVAFPATFKGQTFKGSRTIVINDSKKLTAIQREKADKWIKKYALAWGIGEASVAEINKYGLGKAAKMAFRRAITIAYAKLQITNDKLEYLLIDAFYIPHLKNLPKNKQLPIIKGDSKSISIAAASIIAKVYRDKLMEKLGKREEHKKYRWHLNKGYGTKFHREVIIQYGITKMHRKVFVETYLTQINSFVSSRVQ